MDEQKQVDQPEPIYNSSVPIEDVASKTCRKQWMIGRGGERGSGIFVLMARHDDDDKLCHNKQTKILSTDIFVKKYLLISGLSSYFRICG